MRILKFLLLTLTCLFFNTFLWYLASGVNVTRGIHCPKGERHVRQERKLQSLHTIVSISLSLMARWPNICRFSAGLGGCIHVQFDIQQGTGCRVVKLSAWYSGHLAEVSFPVLKVPMLELCKSPGIVTASSPKCRQRMLANGQIIS